MNIIIKIKIINYYNGILKLLKLKYIGITRKK